MWLDRFRSAINCIIKSVNGIFSVVPSFRSSFNDDWMTISIPSHFQWQLFFSFWNSWAKSDLLVKHLYVFFSSRELDGWILSSGSSGSEISLDPFISFIVSELFPIICNCWLLSRFENYLDFADFERLWRTWTRSQRLSGNSFCDF